jgi:mannosyltransferase OCH1-like enzyme
MIILILIIFSLGFLLYFNFTENFEVDYYQQNQLNQQTNQQSQIPKIIHQIDLGDITQSQKQKMNTWENNYISSNPEFTYILWNSQKIDNELYWTNDLRMIYDTEKDIKGKSYIARMLILFQYGGIFIDENAYWIQENQNDLTRLIDKARNQQTNFFAAREPNENYLSNRIIGSTKQNKVLAFMLNKLEELADGYQEIREKMPVDLVTGMGLLSKADIYNYHITLIPGTMFFPPKVINKSTTSQNVDYLYPTCSYTGFNL